VPRRSLPAADHAPILADPAVSSVHLRWPAAAIIVFHATQPAVERSFHLLGTVRDRHTVERSLTANGHGFQAVDADLDQTSLVASAYGQDGLYEYPAYRTGRAESAVGPWRPTKAPKPALVSAQIILGVVRR